MAGQGDIRAGRAFVEVFIGDSKLQQGRLTINKRLDAWSCQVSALGMRAMISTGAFSVPFVTGAKAFSSFGDQIEKMTYRTGIDPCPRLGFVVILLPTSCLNYVLV